MKKQAAGTPRFSTWVITLMTLIALLVTMTLLGCDSQTPCARCFIAYDMYNEDDKIFHNTTCFLCGEWNCLEKHGEGVCTKEICSYCEDELELDETHEAPCGTEKHYTCDEAEHSKCENCTGFLCADHKKLECGHPECLAEGAESHILPCKHFACEEGDHGELTCGEEHFACDGKDHTPAECGHCAVDDPDAHKKLDCGHFTCAGGTHGVMTCGHMTCTDLMGCGHCAKCEGSSGHEKCPYCGGWFCGGGKDHGVSQCGHIVCEDGADAGHSICSLCNQCAGVGSHGVGVCPSFPCGRCGELTVTEDEHKGACGVDYACDGGNHDLCTLCNTYFCEMRHSAWACGHLCCNNGVDDGLHTMMPCGHWSHNGVPFDGLDHTGFLACGVHEACHYYSDNPELHTVCPHCNVLMCTTYAVDHGDGKCNTGE